MEYAGFWARVGAALIDNILIGVVGGILIAVLGAISEGAIVIGYLLYIVGTFVYFAAFESSNSQATVGKMALNIQVTDVNGRRVGFGRALGRNVAEILSGLPTLFIGYLLVVFTQRKQGLHDLIARTLVVKKGAATTTATTSEPAG